MLDGEFAEFDYREEEENSLSGKFLDYLFEFIIIPSKAFFVFEFMSINHNYHIHIAHRVHSLFVAQIFPTIILQFLSHGPQRGLAYCDTVLMHSFHMTNLYLPCLTLVLGSLPHCLACRSISFTLVSKLNHITLHKWKDHY